MKVWIDQDLCTGDGLCEEIAPDVFTLLDDGLAYVVEDGNVMSDPGGAEALANFADSQLDAVIESAEECPGECITSRLSRPGIALQAILRASLGHSFALIGSL